MASTSFSAPQKGPIALIGGSSFLESSYLSAFTSITVHTPYGAAVVHSNDLHSLYFVQRHAANPSHPYSPPHLINKRAIVSALTQLGVRQVIGFGSVGSLRRDIPVGQLLLPDDFYDTEPVSMFDFDKRGHIGPSFDANLRQQLLSLLSPFSPLPSGTYTQTRGPRFETPAEIRMLAQAGHIVGMTCAHEATLCKEMGLPYAVICMVDNMANGVAGTEISYEEFREGVKRNLEVMERVLRVVIEWAAKEAMPLTDGENEGGKSGDGKRTVDEVISAGWIVPVDDANHATVLEDHSLVVDKGCIVSIIPTSSLSSSPYRPIAHTSLPSHIVLPGLINCHTHIGMTLLRGFADDYCLHTWLTEHIWPAEAAFVNPDFVSCSSELALLELIRGGTTCVNDMYWYPDVLCQLVDRIGYRAMVGLPVLDFPSPWAADMDAYVSNGEKVRNEWGDHPRLTFAVAPHAPYTVCDENLIRCKQIAAAATTGGHRIHTHLHETKAEVEHSIAGDGASRHRSHHNIRPLENLHRLEMVHDQLIAVHMTQLIPSDIALLSKQRAHVVQCPSSNLKLASGICPVTTLLSASPPVNVALGTDSTASNNSLNMWHEMRLAALVAKGLSHDATAVPAYTALRMATIAGAVALGIDDLVGSLEVGKEADVVAVRCDAVELLPMFDPVSHLVYACERSQVSDVWVRGKRLLREGKVEVMDVAAVVERVRRWEAKLKVFKEEQRRKREAGAKPVEVEVMPVLEAPASEDVSEAADGTADGTNGEANGNTDVDSKRQRTE